MITYNHGNFIAQAIESVLMQETDFPIELVIGEDCSTDQTRSIVQQYAEENPGKIRALLHPSNVGMHANAHAVRSACRGEYVAWLEGDDYWTNPRKLHKQVRFLDAHPGCVICFHRVRIVDSQALKQVGEAPLPHFRKSIQPVDALLNECFIYTCSVLYRRAHSHVFPDGFASLPMGDWPSFILMGMRGDIGYIDECMATYRLHPGGRWSGLRHHQRLKGEAEMLNWVAEYLPLRHRQIALKNGKSRTKLARRVEIQQAILESCSGSERERKKYWLTILAALRTDPCILFWRPFASLLLRYSLLGRQAPQRFKQ